MGEHSCRADTAKNRLYIRLSGFFRERDVGPVHRDLEAALHELKPDFDVVTDLSGFVPASPEAISALKKGAEMVKKDGRRNAVRITGGLVSGLMQFKRVLRPVFEEEAVVYAKTILEADEILDAMSAGEQGVDTDE